MLEHTQNTSVCMHIFMVIEWESNRKGKRNEGTLDEKENYTVQQHTAKYME